MPSDGVSNGGRSVISRRKLLQTGVAGGTALSLGGCLGSDDGDEFKIGVPMELSAGWEAVGNTVVDAAELAAREIEDNGGLDGRDIELLVEDNAVDPATTLELTRDFILEDEVDLLFGPISSANRVAMSEEVEENEVPHLYPIQYEGHLAEDYCNEWLFKVGPTPAQNIEPLTPYLLDNYGDEFFLLGDDYLWPEGILSVVREGVEAADGEIIDEVYVDIGTTDFSSIVTRIANDDPDVLVAVVTGEGPIALQEELHDQGVRDQFQDVGIAHGDMTMAGTQAEAADGVIASHTYLPSLENDANQQFVEDFRDEYGEGGMNYLTGLSYTAMKLLEESVDEAGSTDPEDIRDAYASASIESVVGEATMEVDNQVSVGTTITEYDGDAREFVPIETSDPLTPDEVCDEI